MGENAKKVGILSMQRICNFGSFLQAYALKKTIEQLGHEVVFVDYRVEPAFTESKTEKMKYLKRRLRNKVIDFGYAFPCLWRLSMMGVAKLL